MHRSFLLPLVLAGCGSALPTPKEGTQPSNAAILDVVDYPPPPAQAEVVPPAPKDDRCVWIDGRWQWQARRWRWIHGEWAIPPAGCYFAPSVLTWQKPDELWMLEGHWYPDNAEDMPADKARAACGEPRSCGAVARSYTPGQ
jgi:hypothetical protein